MSSNSLKDLVLNYQQCLKAIQTFVPCFPIPSSYWTNFHSPNMTYCFTTLHMLSHMLSHFTSTNGEHIFIFHIPLNCHHLWEVFLDFFREKNHFLLGATKTIFACLYHSTYHNIAQLCFYFHWNTDFWKVRSVFEAPVCLPNSLAYWLE